MTGRVLAARRSISFAPNGGNRIKTRGACGRIDAEEEPDGCAHQDTQNRYPCLDRSRKGRECVKCERRCKAEGYSKKSSDKALHNTLGKELVKDISLRSTRGAPDS